MADKKKQDDVNWEAFDDYDGRPGRPGPVSPETLERLERKWGPEYKPPAPPKTR
jgi:hypothetical protein